MINLSVTRNRFADEVRKHGGLKNTIRKAIKVYSSHGMPGIRYLIRKKTQQLFVLPGQSAAESQPNGALQPFQINYLEQISISQRQSPYYVKRREKHNSTPTPIKLIAYYLPQFHPFPENDAWWGSGFTEWTNVTKAQPLFVGHYQPHLPADLGFYDLRLPEVQKQQMELARQYGIYGFCYYYYWFSGKKLMDQPLRQVLANKELDLPFCISWANENWTRRWDGLDHEVLIYQEYTEADELAFIQDIEPILKDPRYIKVDGKPLLIVYGIYELPNPQRAVATWRDYCRKAGIGELYLAATKRIPGFDPRVYCCDAAIEFPPVAMDLTWDKHNHTFLYPDCEAKLYDYRQCIPEVRKMVGRSEQFPVFHGVMPSWDNTARRPDGKSYVFTNSSPAEYEKWLQVVCEHTDSEHAEPEKMVFINAWNEWGEGAYLEPDRKYGYAYLEATAQIQEEIFAQRYAAMHKENFSKPLVREAAIAVILHLYYLDLWDELSLYLDNISEAFDLYISVTKRFNSTDLDRILARYPRAKVWMVENRGRDIAPFLEIAEKILPLGYQAVCKIHTKKSHHLKSGKGWRPEEGDTWRTRLLAQLLGTKKIVRDITTSFKLNPRLGIIGPGFDLMKYQDAVGANQNQVQYLQNRLKIQLTENFNFFGGSMFWFRPDAIKNILDLRLSFNDFSNETGQIDGTLAHAIERIFNLAVCQAGYQVSCVQDVSSTPDEEKFVCEKWRNQHA